MATIFKTAFSGPRWAVSRDLIRTFKARVDIQSDKIAILNTIWERELGFMAKHWPLVGVKRGVLYVKPASAAAAQELHMRLPGIIRGLNKYFSRSWIKAIKTSFR